MKQWVWVLLFVCAQSVAAGSGGVNVPDQRDKPYLILISIDGFRWDYQDLFDTPTLDRIARHGVRAERMIPVFPTLTFPNHYSIATGLYPANHRLIGNSFPSKDRKRFYTLSDRKAVQDGTWYSGQPVWVAAEKNGMVTAAFFFVGTEAAIDGVAMTYWNQFDASVPGMRRVEQAIEWLEMPDESRPHVITLYFEDVDDATHRYGPGSESSIEAIKTVDGYLSALMSGVESLPIRDDVYVLIVSDHGQANRNDDTAPLILDEILNIDDMIIVDHGSAAFVYLPQPNLKRAASIRDAVNEFWQHGKAMLRSELPESWRATEEAGFSDIVVQADLGSLVFSTKSAAKKVSMGDHGWARESEDMHGIFLASGPRLPKGKRIAAIEAVDVYPLMMEILGLPVTTPIDGDPELLPSLLVP